jgi:hypothetical protein
MADQSVEPVTRWEFDLPKPTVKYRTLTDLAEELRGALRTARVMPAVDASYSKGLQDGLQIAIDFAEKRKRPREI